MFEAPSDGAVIRFDELQPTWNTMHAREDGHIRWITSYYGGTSGQINDNPETGLVSDRTAAGMMWLAAGNRQFGVHEHTVAEIYVILQGQVESIEPGRTQQAGPLDCLYMPPQAPHAVRAVGDEDVVLLWCHDENERTGLSQYYDEEDDRWGSGTPAVKLVRWSDLESRQDGPGALVGGTMRRSAKWVGSPDGDFPVDPAVSAVSERISIGCTVIPAGNAHVPHAHPFAEHYVVLQGRAMVSGSESRAILGTRDYVGFAAGSTHAVRAVGVEPVHLLWIQEEISTGGTTYEAGV